MHNMSVEKSTKKAIKRLWSHLSSRRRKQFFLVSVLMIMSSISEVVSIGALLPFLGMLTVPEQVYQHALMQPIIQILEISDPDQLLLPITILFIALALLAGAIRLVLLYAQTKFSFATGSDLSINIYRRTLYQKYAVHVSRNSSEVINSVITKTNTVIQNTITPILKLISSIVLIIGIISVLLVIDFVVALLTFVGFGFLYWMVISFTRAQVGRNSQIIADQSTQMIKSLQEGLGGIRDVLIDNTQKFYYTLYRNADLPLRYASGKNQSISISPREVMESIGMSLIAGLAYMLMQPDGGAGTVIPLLGSLAFGAQKLLPALQQAYSSYSQIKGSKSSLEDVLDLLDQPLPKHIDGTTAKSIQFEKKIKLTNLDFRHTANSPWVLKNINLSIKKGECVGFMGESGSGKSTLLDIIMGLLEPSNGNIVIDNQVLSSANMRSWQTNISHVPQNIYLSDGTIEENIALGISKDDIDHHRVKEVAKQAQISDVIEQWENGYQTPVGESGFFLSGGQRQRIGIARALYKNVSILIFDEATSALDGKTEKGIMELIENIGKDKGMTVLIVAHRLTTLKECDKIFKLDENYTLRVGSYREMTFE